MSRRGFMDAAAGVVKSGRAWGMALVAVLSVWASPAAGQELDEVDRLALDGRTADARDALLGWWDAEWDDASRSDRERALWLRGLLTLDPVAASASYRRLITEYPVGEFADAALHRLGSLSAAVGDTTAATRWFGILSRDFPESSYALSADAWLDGERGTITGMGGIPVSEAPDPAARAGSAGSDTMADPAGGDPTSGDPVTDPPPADTSTVDVPAGDVPPDDAPTEEPPEARPWTVQLGAFASEDTAREIADEVRMAGFDVRLVLVEDSDLWRIRSGRFPDIEAARPLATRMEDAGFPAAIVPGADREVGGG